MMGNRALGNRGFSASACGTLWATDVQGHSGSASPGF